MLLWLLLFGLFYMLVVVLRLVLVGCFDASLFGWFGLVCFVACFRIASVVDFGGVCCV